MANLPSDELEPTSKNLFLAVDATKDRDVATIVAAGRVDPSDRTSLIAVEVVEQLPPSEAAGRLAELATEHRVREVVIDLYGPMGSIVAQLERGSVRFDPIRVGEVVDAAVGFCDAIAAGRIAHMRDPGSTTPSPASAAQDRRPLGVQPHRRRGHLPAGRGVPGRLGRRRRRLSTARDSYESR